MYFELGQENLKVPIASIGVDHIQVQSMFKCDDLSMRCQPFTVEIKFKCDDLVNQVSI